MDAFHALSTANTDFARRLRLVRQCDWGKPTPCEAWDVRALANHVIGANRRYTMLLHGASATAADATRGADHLGPDAVTSFLATAAEMVAAFSEPGALTRVLHHPAGERTGAELIHMRVLDVAVHTWDLARALDADETLHPDVVMFALACAPVIVAGSRTGAFAAPIDDVPAASTLQQRLLHAVGRQPTS
jgi:uncharacterized protein (TIGR03086 family)